MQAKLVARVAVAGAAMAVLATGGKVAANCGPGHEMTSQAAPAAVRPVSTGATKLAALTSSANVPEVEQHIPKGLTDHSAKLPGLGLQRGDPAAPEFKAGHSLIYAQK